MIFSTEKLQTELKQRIRQLLDGEHPHLVIFRTSDDAASDVYIKQKKNRGEELGFKVSIVDLMPVPVMEWSNTVDDYCKMPDVHGVIVQKPFFRTDPLMKSIEKVINDSIPEVKDVDAAKVESAIRASRYPLSRMTMRACTAMGIDQIITDKFGKDLIGKVVVIINRSDLIGKPLAPMLLKRNATVTVCHSKTPREVLERQIIYADIVVTATGIKGFIRPEMLDRISPYFIVDAGICRVDGKVYGDCDRSLYDSDNVEVTPVPGGVGRLTVLNLLLNTTHAYMKQMLMKETQADKCSVSVQ